MGWLLIKDNGCGRNHRRIIPLNLCQCLRSALGYSFLLFRGHGKTYPNDKRNGALKVMVDRGENELVVQV